MNTLVLSRFRPGRPDGGAALRNLQNIQGLAKLGRVSVLSIHENEEPFEEFEGVHRWQHCQISPPATRSRLRRLVKLIGLVLGKAQHFSLSRYFSKEICDKIQKIITNDDCKFAVIEELSLAHYAPFLKSLGCQVIFDAHNVEGVLRDEMATGKGSALAKWRSNRYSKILYQEEGRVIQLSDIVWACSQIDVNLLKKLYHKASVVVPNGLRIADYESNQLSKNYAGDWSQETLRLLYLGSYSYYPNEDAALILMRDILPQLKKRGREVEIVIVGRGPTQTMKSLAEDLPEVEITGGVESVLPYLEQSCIACLPIRLGSGTRLKILEAFAAMCPVVSTTKGSEGILADTGTHLLRAETSEEFADAVIQIWDDTALRTQLCKEALELAKINYSWESASEQIKKSITER